MTIVRPDFDRRIDLAGVGPCARPVDIDPSATGFMRLVSLRVYAFEAGVTIDGEAEQDEVFVVLMRGAADIAVDQAGTRVGDHALRADGVRVVYLPPEAAYRLVARTDCDIAYARCRPTGDRFPAPRGFGGAEGRLDIADHATGMRLVLASIEGAAQLVEADAAAERIVHVRSDDHGAATVGGERLEDWDSAILRGATRVTIAVEKGKADILLISAPAR